MITMVKFLYLMQVGIMPEYDIPVVCYLVQTTDGKNILIDSGLPEVLPDAEFANGVDVIQQLAKLGLKPEDIDLVISTHYDGDHAGRHAAFTKAQYVVQRAHHADAATNPRFASVKPQWDQPASRIRQVDGDTVLLPGIELIETSGHCVGHQSVLLRLPKAGNILLAVDAVPFAEWYTSEKREDDPEGETLPATIKLMNLEKREHALVIFGHDAAQWKTLKILPQRYE